MTEDPLDGNDGHFVQLNKRFFIINIFTWFYSSLCNVCTAVSLTIVCLLVEHFNITKEISLIGIK